MARAAILRISEQGQFSIFVQFIFQSANLNLTSSDALFLCIVGIYRALTLFERTPTCPDPTPSPASLVYALQPWGNHG